MAALRTAFALARSRNNYNADAIGHIPRKQTRRNSRRWSTRNVLYDAVLAKRGKRRAKRNSTLKRKIKHLRIVSFDTPTYYYR